MSQYQSSSERYRRVAESAPLLLWSNEPDGALIYFNQRYYDYSGLSSDDALRGVWRDSIHPEDRERVLALWEKSFREESDFELECRIRKANGTYRWFLVRACPVRNPEGKLVHWTGSAMDIESRKRAEQEVWQQATLYSQADEAILAWRPDGHIIF